jgi:non-specific serine/threonine protein kinase/serine/threonine-protein kinase
VDVRVSAPDPLTEIFLKACALPAEDRAGYLERECAGNADLRAEVEAMLAADARAGSGEATGALAARVGRIAAELAASAPAPGAAPERIGPYRALDLLGEGGMGVVYRAEQSAPIHRQVALKVIKAGMDTREVVARFEAERQALALMDHPAIAKVFDAGATDRGLPYFAMEYVKGEPITAYCDRHRLTNRERLGLFIQVCEGVQHAHQKGVIHRDLKPSNVLVAVEDGSPIPKIIDFGVAKAIAQRLTEKAIFTDQGILVGTPEYMSPEQTMTGLDIDTRTDIYALGVILYQLLVGALPFDATDLRNAGIGEILRRIREVDPPRPSTRIGTMGEASKESARNRRTEPSRLTGQLKGDLDCITMKALEKDRTRRYESPSDLAADLGRHLRNEPVLAGPPSAVYRSGKFVRRHRLGVAVAAAGVLALAGFGASMAAQAKWIARERDRAERVSEFFVDLFQISEPGEARGNAVTAREILDRGIANVEKELAQEPELQARLMLTMGDVYRNLGLYKEAEPILKRSVEIRRRLSGEENLDTLASLHGLASSLERLGRYEEAEKLYAQVVEHRRRLLGKDHPDTLFAGNGLAVVYARQSRYAEAGKLHRQVLEARRRVLGPDHPDTLTSMNYVATGLKREGRIDEAESLFRETIQARHRTSGPDHPDTLAVERNLAFLYIEQTRWAEADGIIRRVVETSRRVLGETHHFTLSAKDLLAGVLASQGKFDEAEEIYRTCMESLRRQLGKDHPTTLNSMHNLALLYSDRGRYDEAESLFLQTLAAMRRTLGESNASTLVCATELASVHISKGRYEEAEKLLSETLSIERRVLGEKNTRTLYTIYHLGEVAARRGDRSKALAYLRDAVDRGFADLDMATDTDLQSLHGDPAFEEVIATLKENAQQ